MKQTYEDRNENGKTPFDYLVEEAEQEFLRLKGQKKRRKEIYTQTIEDNYDDILSTVNFIPIIREGGKIFQCPQDGCNKSFPSLSRIKRHYIIHTGEKPFACTYKNCKKRFSRRDNMRQHYKGHFRTDQ